MLGFLAQQGVDGGAHGLADFLGLSGMRIARHGVSQSIDCAVLQRHAMHVLLGQLVGDGLAFGVDAGFRESITGHHSHQRGMLAKDQLVAGANAAQLLGSLAQHRQDVLIAGNATGHGNGHAQIGVVLGILYRNHAVWVAGLGIESLCLQHYSSLCARQVCVAVGLGQLHQLLFQGLGVG